MTTTVTPAPTPASAALLDGLRELTNIGTGAALSALGKMLGGNPVDMDLPRSFEGVPASLSHHGTASVVVRLAVPGPTPASFLLVFDQASARALTRRLTDGEVSDPPKAAANAWEMDSALRETGNILACAFLDAWSKMTHTRLLPGPPELLRTFAAEVDLGNVPAAGGALGVEVDFSVRHHKIRGRIVFVLQGLPREAWFGSLASQLSPALAN